MSVWKEIQEKQSPKQHLSLHFSLYLTPKEPFLLNRPAAGLCEGLQPSKPCILLQSHSSMHTLYTHSALRKNERAVLCAVSQLMLQLSLCFFVDCGERCSVRKGTNCISFESALNTMHLKFLALSSSSSPHTQWDSNKVEHPTE